MDVCLLYGVVLSFLVGALKRVPVIAAHPKLTVVVLSGAAGALGAVAQPGTHTAAQLVTCLATQFAAAVATHETVTKPFSRVFFAPDKL